MNGNTIRTLQQRHNEFVEAMGWRGTKKPLEAVALICEEIGELTHELRAPEINTVNVGDEMADIVIRTMDLASEMGIDLDHAIDQKINKNMVNLDHHKAKGRRV